ncbi:MAG: XRE family transcriptional regulator [Microbacterium enclense]
MGDEHGAAAAIGAAVRAHRRSRGLSMRHLASLIGTSQPFVSNIENGRIFPSLRTLRLLADALEVPSDHLLPTPERFEHTNVDAHPRGSDDAPTQLLLEEPGRRLRIVRIELSPAESEPQPHTHAGEEFLRIVLGDVTLLRESTAPHRLRRGEGLWMAGGVPHRLEAGPEGATALTVLTGAAPGAHA